MKINDKFEIKEIPHGYKLIKQIQVKETIKGKPTGKLKHGIDETYYGTMKQALKGFVNHSIGDPETIDELKTTIVSIRNDIVSLHTDIEACESI